MARIPLTQGKFAEIDDRDVQLVSRYTWCAHRQRTGNWYALTNIPDGNGHHKSVHMHRLICNAPKGMEVDHIDGDGLNNRRENLRVASRPENQWNMRRPHLWRGKKSSRFKGVYFYKRTNRWCAQIKFGERKICLGYFRTEEDAARAYDAKAHELFGAFAVVNFTD